MMEFPKVEKKVIHSLILKVCDHKRNTASVLFILDTGIRVSELTAINADDLMEMRTVIICKNKE